jgi:hypothetical protein
MNNSDTNSPKDDRKKLRKNSQKNKCLLLNDILSSKSSTTIPDSPSQQTSSTNITCLSILKQIFHQSSSSNIDSSNKTNILTY